MERKRVTRGVSQQSSTTLPVGDAQAQARSSFMLLLQKGQEKAASSRNTEKLGTVLTTLPQTPEIGAIEEDEEPGGIGKFFKTVVQKQGLRVGLDSTISLLNKQGLQGVKKPPLPKNGSA